MSIRIYDNATEPTLTNALIDKGGWKQAGPKFGTNGYLDLAEKIRLTWMDLDDDTRAAILRDFGKLSRKAVITNSPERPEYYDRAKAVVLEAKTPTEGQARYAMLRSLVAPQLHQWHQASARPLYLDLELEREGLWRGVAPGAVGDEVISETVQNYTYQTNRNYVTIAPDAIPGDAPALAKIHVTTTVPGEQAAGSRLWLMRKLSPSLTELNAFNPYFWMVSATNTPTTTVATATPLNGFGPAAIPGDRLADHANTDSGTITYNWAINNNLAAYAGTYGVWVVYRCQVANGGQVYVDHGWGTGNPTNSLGKIFLPSQNTLDFWNYLYLGEIRMPPGGMINGVAPAFFGSYAISLRLSGGHPTTPYRSQVAGFLLQPIDDQVYQANQAGWQFADGDLRRSWQTNAAGTTFTAANLQAEGDYIEVEPGYYNRIYINTTGPFFSMGVTYTVKVSIIPRYQYLRGNETW